MTLRLTEAEYRATLGGRSPQKAARVPRQAIAAAAGGVLSVTLELPLPLAKCSPNARFCGHWSAAAEARRDYKAECLACLPRIDYMFGKMFAAATIRTEWFLGPAEGRYHPRDQQNATASLKAAVDAIVDAGYLPDDSSKYLTWGETVLRTARESGGRACVVVTLERREF